jgi:hypothetical protein
LWKKLLLILNDPHSQNCLSPNYNINGENLIKKSSIVFMEA